jgi:hypothetical protein
MSQLKNNLANKYEITAFIIIIILGFFLRIYVLPDALFLAETHNVFQGIRLHTLDLFNFSDHISENYFKSFFGAIAGIRHVLSVYLSSGIYEFLNIPINAFWILGFYVLLGTISVVLTYILGCKLFDSRIFGLFGAFIMAIHPGQIASSRTDNAEATVTLFVLITLILLLRYKEKPSSHRRTLLSLSLVIIASMETIILLPLFFIYQIILFSIPEGRFSIINFEHIKYLLSKDNIIIWTPTVLVLIIHYYVYLRVGDSNIGLFGYAINLSQPIQLDGIKGNYLWHNFVTYSEYYYNAIFFSSSIIAFLFLIIYKLKKNKISDTKPLIFLFIGSLYFFLLIFIGIGGTNSYFYIHDGISILFISSIWVFLIKTLTRNESRSKVIIYESRLGLFKQIKIDFLLSIILTSLLVIFISINTVNTIKTAYSRQPLIHPLKSMGYYINENSDKDPTAYIMLPCHRYNVLRNAEFYLGTQMMDEEVHNGKPRKQFCMGSKSVEETLDIYSLDDFDFYISIDNLKMMKVPEIADPINIKSKVNELLANGIRRVAIIKNDETILGEIFSRKDLPLEELQISKYDILWDKKYANISGIIKTNWSGQTSTWGFLYNPETGVKRGIE